MSALQQMSPSLPLSQSRLNQNCPPHDLGHFSFPSQLLGLAVLRLAWLDLAVDQSPNSRTYKSEWYTSQLKQHTAQHSNYIYRHTFILLYIFTGELKRPVGHYPVLETRMSSVSLSLPISMWISNIQAKAGQQKQWSDEAMKQCDEALNASSLQFLCQR